MKKKYHYIEKNQNKMLKQLIHITLNHIFTNEQEIVPPLSGNR
jgi:hypothetical protein